MVRQIFVNRSKFTAPLMTFDSRDAQKQGGAALSLPPTPPSPRSRTYLPLSMWRRVIYTNNKKLANFPRQKFVTKIACIDHSGKRALCLTFWEHQAFQWNNKFFKNTNTVTPVLSEPNIKRTPSIKWTPAWVAKFSSHIYCKINLYPVDTSVKRKRTPILSHFGAQILQ